MKILPISNHKKNTNFKAVVPEYLKRAKWEYSKTKGITEDLLFCLETDMEFKAISARDTIDTLEAIRPYTKGIEWYFNQLMDSCLDKLRKE